MLSRIASLLPIPPADSGIFRQIPLPCPGRLFVSPMPYGTYDVGGRVFRNYRRKRVEHVVLLVSNEEIAKKGRRDVKRLYQKHGISYSQFEWRDLLAPSLELLRQATLEVTEHLRRGTRVAVHCHAGVGRTGIVAAGAVMTITDRPPREALDYLEEHMLINITEDQKQLVEQLYAGLHAVALA